MDSDTKHAQALSGLHRQHGSLMEEATEHRNQIELSEAEFTSCRDHLRTLKQRRSQLEDESKVHASALQSLAEAHDRRHAELRACQEQGRVLRRRSSELVDKHELSIAELRDEHRRLANLHAGHQLRNGRAGKDHDLVRSDVDQRLERGTQMVHELGELKEQISQLEDECQQERRRMEMLQDRYWDDIAGFQVAFGQPSSASRNRLRGASSPKKKEEVLGEVERLQGAKRQNEEDIAALELSLRREKVQTREVEKQVQRYSEFRAAVRRGEMSHCEALPDVIMEGGEFQDLADVKISEGEDQDDRTSQSMSPLAQETTGLEDPSPTLYSDMLQEAEAENEALEREIWAVRQTLHKPSPRKRLSNASRTSAAEGNEGAAGWPDAEDALQHEFLEQSYLQTLLQQQLAARRRRPTSRKSNGRPRRPVGKLQMPEAQFVGSMEVPNIRSAMAEPLQRGLRAPTLTAPSLTMPMPMPSPSPIQSQASSPRFTPPVGPCLSPQWMTPQFAQQSALSESFLSPLPPMAPPLPQLGLVTSPTQLPMQIPTMTPRLSLPVPPDKVNNALMSPRLFAPSPGPSGVVPQGTAFPLASRITFPASNGWIS
mmetsp:Transcript_35809/g.76387  ORF Transcript_35809/g.76387 Transcript_35809/m.76387 type:complete len:599 (+) Transcript_35809:139-1935(+)